MTIPYHDDLDRTDAVLADAFPLSGQTTSLGIKVGSIGVAIRLLKTYHDEVVSDLLKRYEPFIWTGESAYTAQITRNADLDLSLYTDIMVKSRDHRFHYIFRWDFIARFDMEQNHAVMLMMPGSSSLCIDTLFRIIFSFAAASQGSFLMHAAAIATPMGGILFPGVTQSGKSTLAEISLKTYDVITDDMALVEFTGDSYRVQGTPFWGQLQMSVNRSAKLATVFLLSRGDKDGISTVSSAEAAGEFMTALLCFGQEQGLFSKMLLSVSRLFEHVPFRRLTFSGNSSVLPLVEETLAADS